MIMTGKSTILTLIAILGIFASTVATAGLKVEHDLRVELFPAEKKLIGRDHMRINTGDDESLRFRLSARAEQISVEVNTEIRKSKHENGWLKVPLTLSAWPKPKASTPTQRV